MLQTSVIFTNIYTSTTILLILSLRFVIFECSLVLKALCAQCKVGGSDSIVNSLGLPAIIDCADDGNGKVELYYMTCENISCAHRIGLIMCQSSYPAYKKPALNSHLFQLLIGAEISDFQGLIGFNFSLRNENFLV